MAKKRKKKYIIAPVIRIPVSLERAYRIQLNKVGQALVQSVREEILSYLKSNYTPDSLSNDLFRRFKNLSLEFDEKITAGFGESSASNMVEKVNEVTREKFNNSVASSIGIDLGNIIQVEGLDDFIKLSVNRNVSLIKSLPEQYLTQVETIVSNGLVGGKTYATVEKEITALVGSANSKLANRIRTIARNEVQTISSQLALRRSMSLGITEGIFRTSEDERVRPCHAEINSKRYKLNKGAWSPTCQKHIQPGITDINCRCNYSPVIPI